MARPKKSELHPTTKPVELIEKAVKNSSYAKANVLDLFGGSGSTMMGCEKTGRNNFSMELDPKYADVVRKRYAKLIGKESEWITETPVI